MLLKYKLQTQADLVRFKEPDTTHCLSSFIPMSSEAKEGGKQNFEYLITKELEAMFALVRRSTTAL